MTPAAIIEQLSQAGLHLTVEGENLRLKGPSEIIIQHRETLRQHKQAILKYLQADFPALSPLQQASRDFTQFCQAHELTLPGSICRVKADRRAPMDACTGWRLRMSKADLPAATQALERNECE
jgi:hypothetical protein